MSLHLYKKLAQLSCTRQHINMQQYGKQPHRNLAVLLCSVRVTPQQNTAVLRGILQELDLVMQR